VDHRFPGADILRGIAVLAVVIYHACGRNFGFYLPWEGWWRDFHSPPTRMFLALYPVSFGWAGVALFFSLSGFCIHVSFLRSRHFTAREFFWRRFWRIYPAYVVALAAFSCLARLDFTSASGLKLFLSHATLIHNLHNASFFGINPSFWSIGTEIQLYLLFPLLLYFRERFGMRTCLGITLATGLVWRIVAITVWGLPEHLISAVFCSPFMTWFDWALGAYVAEQALQGKPAFTRHGAWLATLVPAFVASTLFKPLTCLSFSLAAVVSALGLDLIVRAPVGRGFVARSLAFVGTISYSVYLWHQPLLAILPGWFGRFLPAPSLATALAIALISYISYEWLERPGIKVGKYLWDRQSDRSR